MPRCQGCVRMRVLRALAVAYGQLPRGRVNLLSAEVAPVMSGGNRPADEPIHDAGRASFLARLAISSPWSAR